MWVALALAAVLPVDDVLERSRVRRGAVPSDAALWPGCTVPYRFVVSPCAPDLPASVCGLAFSDPSAARRSVVIAADEVERKTGCIFSESATAAATAGTLLVVSDPGTCYVDVLGRRSDRYNLMSLGWCAGSEAAVKHELLHVLGLDHEHESPASVGMLTRCAAGTCVPNDGNCRVRSVEYTATAYDPASIMHYPLGMASACDLALTAAGSAALSGLSANEVGRVSNISALDAAAVRTAYGLTVKSSKGSKGTDATPWIAGAAGLLLLLVAALWLLRPRKPATYSQLAVF